MTRLLDRLAEPTDDRPTRPIGRWNGSGGEASEPKSQAEHAE
jgi:hypothetical protein